MKLLTTIILSFFSSHAIGQVVPIIERVSTEWTSEYYSGKYSTTNGVGGRIIILKSGEFGGRHLVQYESITDTGTGKVNLGRKSKDKWSIVDNKICIKSNNKDGQSIVKYSTFTFKWSYKIDLLNESEFGEKSVIVTNKCTVLLDSTNSDDIYNELMDFIKVNYSKIEIDTSMTDSDIEYYNIKELINQFTFDKGLYRMIKIYAGDNLITIE